MPNFLFELLTPIKQEKTIKEARKDFNVEIKTKEIISILNCIKQERIENYDKWVKIGMIIYNELKKYGREIYHKVSFEF